MQVVGNKIEIMANLFAYFRTNDKNVTISYINVGRGVFFKRIFQRRTLCDEIFSANILKHAV